MTKRVGYWDNWPRHYLGMRAASSNNTKVMGDSNTHMDCNNSRNAGGDNNADEPLDNNVDETLGNNAGASMPRSGWARTTESEAGGDPI